MRTIESAHIDQAQPKDFTVQKISFSIQTQQRCGWLCLVSTCAAFFSLVHTTPARACACCSDPGMRFEATNDINQYEKDELGRIRFDDTAQLFLTPVATHNTPGAIGFTGIIICADRYHSRV